MWSRLASHGDSADQVREALLAAGLEQISDWLTDMRDSGLPDKTLMPMVRDAEAQLAERVEAALPQVMKDLAASAGFGGIMRALDP